MFDEHQLPSAGSDWQMIGRQPICIPVEEKGMKIPTKIYAEYCDDVDEKNRYYYAYVLSKIITDFSGIQGNIKTIDISI